MFLELFFCAFVFWGVVLGIFVLFFNGNLVLVASGFIVRSWVSCGFLGELPDVFKGLIPPGLVLVCFK